MVEYSNLYDLNMNNKKVIIIAEPSIGDFSVISSHCDITGNVNIGKNVYLGSRVSIIPSKKICDNVSIGTRSVVFKNIRIPVIYIGNPSKKIFNK
jgi:UDP-3-O-[3-hydroxymyristoyl] glucosamine N-acyltransferase